MEQEQFLEIPIEQLKKSPTNPRRTRDPKRFEELCISIKDKGIIQPIVVRANGGASDYEIVVGEGRYLAARKVGLSILPAMVRKLSDLDVIEIQLIENKHREDFNCIDEAEGLNRLVKGGYSIERIAQKIGLSEKYVYDRIKLLNLIPEAKTLVLRDRMTPGHAILLARLRAQDQERAIDLSTGGLFEGEESLFDEEAKDLPTFEKKYFGWKTRSIRELEAWIDNHVRFDRNAPVSHDLFPETAAAVKKAVEEKEKIIQITHESFIQPDAKEGNNERIFTERTWKLADGSKKDAKACEKSVTGVIVIGPDRGNALKVCVNKDCPTHWGREKRERERRQRMEPSAAQERMRKEDERRRAQAEREEAQREAWKKAIPAIKEITAAKIKAAKFSVLAQLIDRSLSGTHALAARKAIGKGGKNPEKLLAIIALAHCFEKIGYYWDCGADFRGAAKTLGIDLKPLLKEQEKEKAA